VDEDWRSNTKQATHTTELRKDEKMFERRQVKESYCQNFNPLGLLCTTTIMADFYLVSTFNAASNAARRTLYGLYTNSGLYFCLWNCV